MTCNGGRAVMVSCVGKQIIKHRPESFTNAMGSLKTHKCFDAYRSGPMATITGAHFFLRMYRLGV